MRPVAVYGHFAMMASLFLVCLAGAIFFDNAAWILLPFVFLLLLAGWRNPRLVFFLLILSIPFSTELFFENGLSTDFPDEPFMWLTSLLIVAYLFSARRNPTVDQRTDPIALLLLAWLGWTAVSAAISDESFVSWKFFLAKTWYLAAFFLPFLVWKDPRTARNTIACLLFSMTLVVGLILWKHQSLGFSFASINEAVTPFFRNHVNYSSLLVCCLPFLLFFVAGEKNLALRLLFILLVAIFLLAIYLSYARGAWLALLAGAFAYFLIRGRFIIRSMLAVMLLALLALAWLQKNDRYLAYAPHFQTTIFHPDFKEHLVATYRLKDISTAERFHRWIAGFRMIGERPITGFGPNRFTTEYQSYTIPAYKTWVSDNPERSGIHNYLLLLATEQGIPSVILFLLLAGAMLYYSQRIYHRAKLPGERRLAMACGVVTVMILVLNQLSDLIETDKVGSVFFLVAGMISALNSRTNVQRVP